MKTYKSKLTSRLIFLTLIFLSCVLFAVAFLLLASTHTPLGNRVVFSFTLGSILVSFVILSFQYYSKLSYEIAWHEDILQFQYPLGRKKACKLNDIKSVLIKQTGLEIITENERIFIVNDFEGFKDDVKKSLRLRNLIIHE